MKYDRIIRTGAPAACDEEQIQFLNRIQSTGCLLEVSADWNVVRVSDNLSAILGIPADEALGMPLSQLLGSTATHDLRGALQLVGADGGVNRIFEVTLQGLAMARADLSVSRSGESILVECEPSSPPGDDISVRTQTMLSQLRGITSIERLGSIMAGQIRSLCGYDRVMTYQFQDDDSGEVIAERKAAGMESFDGLRFPATDIPAQARALYLRNPVRVIADAAAPTAALVPQRNHLGQMLDLSMVSLRAVSPVHIEYLQNMGVQASMSISLIVDDRLWGLLACHHNSPRYLSPKTRVALEFYGRMASAIIETLVRRREALARQRARDIHMRMLSLVSVDANGADNMFALLGELRTNLRADGMATLMEGRLRSEGATPGPASMAALFKFLNSTAVSEVYASNCLAEACPGALSDGSSIAGVIAVPISRAPRDYVLFFRNELVREVTWAGKPEKFVSNDGSRYSPRKSFASWKELVRGQSAHWGAMEREKCEALRITLLEVMLRLTDSAEKMRKQNNEQQDTLIAELNHRVRNILNLIVGLVRQCGETATSTAVFTEEINSRIHALARAHDQLTSSGWKPRSLSNMVRVEAGAYLGAKASRVLIRGNDWAIEPDAFATLALVFHELITNAAKYGAFKDSRGRAELDIERLESGGLHLRWSEHGGSLVTAPVRRGFGSTIIERAIPHELSGMASTEYAPTGLVATFQIPARYIAPCADEVLQEISNADELAPQAATPVAGSSILLVEDNLLIALETESTLLDLGAESVEVVSTVSAALDLLRSFRPDFAVLDYNLGRETSVAIAERLSDIGVPFLFVTGYGDSSAIDARFRHLPIVSKPYDAKTLIRKLAGTNG